MDILCKIVVLLLPLSLAYYIYLKIDRTEPLPQIEDEYWGPKAEHGKDEDASIHPFKISVSAASLDDLKTRLKRELDSNRLVSPLEGIGFEYGFNSKYLNTVGQYWLNRYDWEAREKLLNKYPQYKTEISGLDIHFYHVKPLPKEGVQIRPLILLHGWPGSVVEYQKIIPLLSEPKNSNFNYELIIPSLPGFGFSSPARRPGLHTVPMANIFKRLMQRLSHEKFYMMGNDWGGIITQELATIYPDSVLGAHSTNCIDCDLTETAHLKHIIASTFPSLFATPEVAKHITPWWDFFSFMIREMGYTHIQGTKPDTVGVALTHSPLGLAAYILEKFSTFTNRTWISREDGGLEDKFTLDELLDNIMIYWITGSITTSSRIYYEALAPNKQPILDRFATNVPFDCYYLPGDIFMLPEFVLRSKFTNIKRHSVSPKGGHFGALEVPELLAKDAISFFNSL